MVERKIDNYILDGYPKLGLDNLTSAATKLIRGAAGLLTETQTMPLTSESAPVLAQVLTCLVAGSAAAAYDPTKQSDLQREYLK